MAKTTHFEEATKALRGQAFSVYIDNDTVFAGWWPMHRPVPVTPGIRDGRVVIEFTGRKEVFVDTACAEFRAVEEDIREAVKTRLRTGAEDFIETHEQDDLRDFSDSEAWADMRGEDD